MVEISKEKERNILKNYGELKLEAIYKDSFRTFDKNTLLLSTKNVAKVIKAVLMESEIKTKEAIFSLPDFSTFFTTFELPKMSQKEMQQAIEFEARKYIPIPISEVILDWQIIPGDDKGKENSRILIIAVPKSVVDQYKSVAKEAGLKIIALEAEVLGLKRSVVKNKKTSCLVDIGTQSTTVSIVDENVLRTSSSFDLAGKDLTFSISKALGIEEKEAEKIKREKGMIKSGEHDLEQILAPILDLMVSEIKKVSRVFWERKHKDPEEIIISGGGALMPGLVRYFEKELLKTTRGVKIRIADPFSDIFYPPLLEQEIKKMGPTYAIAVGEALKGFE